VVDVHAFSDEGALRALTTHLESCQGNGDATESGRAERAS
jgi:hypothetical protein